MNTICQNFVKCALTLLCVIVVSTKAQAHLMVAQHGTLNFLDNNVYMVLSLPANAFDIADEDDDGLLSLTEFSTHRAALIESVSNHVSLSTKAGKLPVVGLMLSPVTPHDAPKDPADQIIVMGRFVLDESDSELSFHVGLFGTDAKSQSLEMTASRKSQEERQVFALNPMSQTIKLNFN